MLTQQQLNERYEYLTQQAKDKRCLRCDKYITVAWVNGLWLMRCRCFPEAPMDTLVDETQRRYGQMVNDNLPKDLPHDLVTIERHAPLSIEEFDQRLTLVKYVVAQMIEGVHFGLIPGTYDKSLWEPGAEYLRMAFRIPWNYEVLEKIEDFSTYDYRYRVRAYVVGDVEGAAWTAFGWSKERKFWCSTKRGCPQDCAQDHLPMTEPAMLPHNVLDRTIKRAFVALMRNVTGTSCYFKQALPQADTAGKGVRQPAKRQHTPTGEPGEPSPNEGSSPAGDSLSNIPRSFGELFNRAYTLDRRLVKPKVLEALGVKDQAEITDYAEAWEKIMAWVKAHPVGSV